VAVYYTMHINVTDVFSSMEWVENAYDLLNGKTWRVLMVEDETLKDNDVLVQYKVIRWHLNSAKSLLNIHIYTLKNCLSFYPQNSVLIDWLYIILFMIFSKLETLFDW